MVEVKLWTILPHRTALVHVAVYLGLCVTSNHTRAQDHPKDHAKRRAEHHAGSTQEWITSESITGPILGLSLGLFGEQGTREATTSIGDLTEDEGTDYRTRDPFSLSFTAAKVLSTQVPSGHLRAGALVRYEGRYKTRADGENYTYGTLAEWGGLLEWSITGLPMIDLVLGMRGGLTTLFPGQDFRAEINTLKGQGVSVWGGPRLGGFLTPQIGAEHTLVDGLLRARADLGLSFRYLPLLAVREDLGNVTYEQQWFLQSTRIELILGFILTP